MRKTLLLFLTSMLWTVSLSAGGQAGLQFSLEIDKGTYAPYEPIVLRYWVENTSQKEVSVPGSILADCGWIKLEIAREDGAFKPYRTGELAECWPRSVSLEPGKRLSSQVVVATNLYGRAARTNRQYTGTPLFPFSEADTYRIRGTYPIASEDGSGLTSDTVEFSVRVASDDEAEAFAFFGSPDEYAAAVGADGDVDDVRAAMQRWEEFVERYPRSTYTPPVQLQLGRLYLNGIGMEHPDPARAAVHFRAVAESGREGFADDALVQLAKSQIEQGRIDDAQATLARILEQSPNSEQRAEVIRLRDGLAKGWRTLHDIYGN